MQCKLPIKDRRLIDIPHQAGAIARSRSDVHNFCRDLVMPPARGWARDEELKQTGALMGSKSKHIHLYLGGQFHATAPRGCHGLELQHVKGGRP